MNKTTTDEAMVPLAAMHHKRSLLVRTGTCRRRIGNLLVLSAVLAVLTMAMIRPVRLVLLLAHQQQEDGVGGGRHEAKDPPQQQQQLQQIITTSVGPDVLVVDGVDSRGDYRLAIAVAADTSAGDDKKNHGVVADNENENDDDDDDDEYYEEEIDVNNDDDDSSAWSGRNGGNVTHIRHWPHNSTIVVEFHPQAVCRNPVLRGRLSGPSLAIIEWTRRHYGNGDGDDPAGDGISSSRSRNRTLALIGRYQVPTGGRHYVEIIALLCEEWEDYGTNFKSICLEDPRHHRLTASNATVNVIIAADVATDTATDAAATAAAVSRLKNDDNHVVVGYWQWKSSSTSAGGDGTVDLSSSSIVEPLYTRWQRKTCGPDGVDYCPETGSLDRFQPYHFTWSNASLSADLSMAYARSSTRLCYVGSSHAKQLLGSTRKLLGPAGVNVTYSYTRYPEQVTGLLLQNIGRRITLQLYRDWDRPVGGEL